ncbi:MAG: hypothetical protein Q7S87_11915 [Agitococcus sp.]|nr:hypothetical protein [Agitococcus sp.]
MTNIEENKLNPFTASTLDEVAGCLQFIDATKQPEDIEAIIRQKLREELKSADQ